VDFQRLGHDPGSRHARVQAGVWILEDHLHPPPDASQGRAFDGGDLLTFEDDLATGWAVQAQDRPPHRALATTGFAHQPDGFALPDRKRNAVDRPDVADVATYQDSPSDREEHLEVGDLQQRPRRVIADGRAGGG
jgi:hypothetical protein